MEKFFAEVLIVLGNTFRRVERLVPPPQMLAWGDSYVFRHAERDVHQAILQKFARVVSGLHAVLNLLQHGLLQEQGVIQRTLDDLSDDVFFLLTAIGTPMKPIHHAFLANFFAEEFDPHRPGIPVERPPPVERRKIRAHNLRELNPNANRSKTLDARSILYSGYSGYVHAASPHIMDMYGGSPPRFHIEGMLDTVRMDEHKADAWNYFYRGLLTAIAVAKAFGDASLADSLAQYTEKFVQSEPD